MPVLLSAVYTFTPAAIPVALTALLILAFGVRVVSRRFTSVSAAFFGMTAVVAVWMASFTFMYSARDAATALVWARRAYFGVPFIAPAIYWFTVEILRIERRRRLAHVAAWSGAAFFSALAVLTSNLIPSVQRYWWGFYPRYSPMVGAGFLLFFFGYLIASLAEFVRAYPHARGTEQLRIRALIVAFAFAYLGCVDYLPKYGIAAYPFGYAAILGFVIVAGRAIRRYDLVALTPSLAAQEIISTMAWQDRGAGPMRVAVNLSARQVQQHDLVDMVRSALDESSLGASSLDLEITETTAMQNAEATVETLHALRALGVGISIDDFGMGYSSLNYLKRFPLNAVKIDRAFVNDITSNNGDAAIVSAVIGMARSLRLRVLAEGVETAEQFAFLRSRECDEAQGYYFSRPIDAEDMTRMLIDRRAVAVREPRVTV